MTDQARLAAYYIAQIRADLEAKKLAHLCPHGVEPALCADHRTTPTEETP